MQVDSGSQVVTVVWSLFKAILVSQFWDIWTIFAAMEPWEVKKDEVLKQLQLLDSTELGEVCVGLSITIPPAKMGKRSAILNLIMRNINSEEVEESGDAGLGLFTDLDNQLKRILSTRVKDETKITTEGLTEKAGLVTTAVVTSGGEGTSLGLKNSNSLASNGDSSRISPERGAGTASVDAGVRYHLNRLAKEFKIHGGFVASGDAPISYSNLKFQLEDGKEQGYKDKELISGVIRAIKPNSKLRNYLESAGKMPMETLLKHIKNHYALTDSSKLLTNLSACVQGPNQKVQEFIDQLAGMRNDIVTVSKEEGNPLDPEMIRRRFLHAISVGLRKETIRVEIQALLKNTEITDEELGEQVQHIVAREEEHEKKMEEIRRGKGASVNSMTADEKSTEGKAIFEELSKISARVNELSITKSSEVSVLQEQVCQMEARLRELGAKANGGANFGYSDMGWQGQDGTTYYSNNDSSGGSRGDGHGNRGGGFGGRGSGQQGGRGSNGNRGHDSNRGSNRGNYNNNQGGFNNNCYRGGFNDNGNRGGFNNNGNRGGFNNYNGNCNGYENQNDYHDSYDNNYSSNTQQNDYQNSYNDYNNYNSNFDGNRGRFNGKRGGFNGGSRGGNRGRGSSNRGGYHGNRGGRNGGNNFPFIKCEPCQISGAKCYHCSTCGASDHKRAACPKNE